MQKYYVKNVMQAKQGNKEKTFFSLFTFYHDIEWFDGNYIFNGYYTEKELIDFIDKNCTSSLSNFCKYQKQNPLF